MGQVLNWLTRDIGVDPKRIVLLGHSLGTAVATAAAVRSIGGDSRRDNIGPDSEQDGELKRFPFAGLLLSGGFTNIPELLRTYVRA